MGAGLQLQLAPLHWSIGLQYVLEGQQDLSAIVATSCD